jgi:GNAT superfamily N-acetyltransferase
MDALEIRSAAAADIPSLVRLNAQVQAQHAAAYPELFSPPSDADARAHFERVLADTEYRVRVAVRAGAYVGHTVARSERRGPNAFRRAYEVLLLHEICVDSRQRRSGVGAALMSDLQSHAADLGLGMVLLDTWAFNIDAHRFFESQGFSPQRIVMWRRSEP